MLKKLTSVITIAFMSVTALALSIFLYARYLYPDADYPQIMLTIFSLSPDVIKEVIYPADYAYALIFFLIVWPLCYLYLSTKQQFLAALIMGLAFLYLTGWPQYAVLSRTTSTLYEKHYVYPDTKIPAPENPRNLILIYLESFEQNYLKPEHYGSVLLPRLQQLQQKNNHSMNYRALNSTNYSIGALVATHCGIPLIFTQERDMYTNSFFLPETTCFPEILKANGYQTKIIKAADIRFTDADKFTLSHGYDTAWGTAQILQNYPEFKDPKYRGAFGGLSDRALYEVAQKELARFAPDKPFMLTLFSLDTHTPPKPLDNTCPPIHGDLRDNYICADTAIGEFIDWLKTSPYSNNTTVIILGDHLLPGRIKTNGHPKRTIFNVFLNLPENLKLDRNKTFTALDIPASILESLNFTLKDHAFGLGRSIFADTPNLVETIGASLNRYLMQHSAVYDKLSNPSQAHIDIYKPYNLGDILDNHALARYTDISEDLMGLYYLDRLNLALSDLPDTATELSVTVKFNTIFSTTGQLTVTANGTELLKFHPDTKQKPPYTLNFTIPVKKPKDNRLQLKFHNNSNTRHIITLGIAPLALQITPR